ncbi:UNVERIFIED_CONTAM: Hexose carrier protein HEX6 [Sesamum radiatum]|uniref:Hexose carrier protein HEX6 n=1 Tax=Sesamum radiatum TaxID=300843 RepID=A0AAW2TF31_SESRA
MAVALEIKSDSRQYNGRITVFALLSCMVAATGGIIFSYDVGVSGSFSITYLMGSWPHYSFFASSVTRAFGRKPSIVIGGAAFVLGAALGVAARNIYMLIFGRALLGVGLGFTIQRRLGLVNIPRHGRSPSSRPGSWSSFSPETPNSLIQHSNDHEKAKRALQRVRGTTDVQVELDDLIEASHASKAIKHPYKNLMKRKYRPQLVMSIAIPFFQQVTGINVIAFYAPVLFRSIGSGESASLMSAVVIGLAGTSFTLLTSLLVDRLGRRALFHVGGIQMLVSQMLIGGIMAAKLGDHGGLSKGYGIVVLILICVYVAGFGLSWGPLGWAVTSEIFPLEIRSAAQSVVPSNALPFEIWNFLRVWRMGTADDCICVFVAA